MKPALTLLPAIALASSSHAFVLTSIQADPANNTGTAITAVGGVFVDVSNGYNVATISQGRSGGPSTAYPIDTYFAFGSGPYTQGIPANDPSQPEATRIRAGSTPLWSTPLEITFAGLTLDDTTSNINGVSATASRTTIAGDNSIFFARLIAHPDVTDITGEIMFSINGGSKAGRVFGHGIGMDFAANLDGSIVIAPDAGKWNIAVYRSV